MLVGKPVAHIEIEVVESLHPHVAPAAPNDRWIGRPGTIQSVVRPPDEHVLDNASAFVVRIVGVAIVRGAMRDDGPECGRATCRHLQGTEAAPGDPVLSNLARAPWLLR